MGSLLCMMYSLAAQTVKNLPAVQETQFPYLGWEDSLEKEMVTHSSILAWRIPWTLQHLPGEEEGLLPGDSGKSGTNGASQVSLDLIIIREGKTK